jgi:hypothetical protein
MFQTKFVEKIKTHFVFSNLFFETRPVYEIIWEKYCTAVQATDGSILLAQCMLDT